MIMPEKMIFRRGFGRLEQLAGAGFSIGDGGGF